jgi:hypothetical protein
MNFIARLLHRWRRRRVIAQIRETYPDLAAAVDESSLIAKYLELATDALAKAEADYEAIPEEQRVGAYPQAPQLLIDALPYFTSASKESYVLLTLKQHREIDLLKTDKAWLSQQLELNMQLNKIYEDREVIFQQVLDEAGIDAEMIDRMAIKVNSKSIDLNNRSN